MIYLDNASTQPIMPKALDAMMQIYSQWGDNIGNPSASGYQIANKSISLLKKFRADFSQIFNVPDNGIIVFTSSASESNNMVLQSAKLPIICDILCHPSITNFPNIKTYRTLDELDSILGQTPHLVSISLVQHELGILSNIDEIKRIIAKHKSKLHIDASQAKNVDVTKLDADFITLSSHKLGGPIGVGACITKSLLDPLIFGGSQEHGMRASTQALPLIAGFVMAASEMQTNNYYQTKFSELKSILKKNIDTKFFAENYIDANFVDYIICLHLPFPASELVAFMDINNIAVSQGSACTSGSLDGMESIKKLNIPNLSSKNAIRISFGHQTLSEEIIKFTEKFNSFVKLRAG